MNTNYKIALIPIAFALWMTSCGEPSSLDQLIAKQTKLEGEIKAKQGELKEVEGQIKEMDTTQSNDVVYPRVSIVNLKTRTFNHFFEIQGSLEAEKNVMVVPETGGLIKSLPVKEGQYISKGQTIATFDSDVIASNIKELEEQLELAKYMYEKQKSLMDQGVGTEINFKQAEGQYQSLQKTLNTLKTQKGKFVLKAPFSGYVEQVFPVVGEMAGPASPIIQLIDLSNMKATAAISEAYLKNLNGNNLVNVYFPALDKELKDLEVKRIGKFVNPVNRTVTLEVNIPKTEGNMVPNLMTVMNVRDYKKDSAIVVPSSVILKDANQESYVYVLENGKKAVQTKITTGQSYKGETEVLAGLSNGDVVIDKGARKLVDGDIVTVVE
ncbi:MAG: efflux RND transporter periplasmic adaptor subunit [Flavobacteriales bacterium]|jgi:RND family efflux transporter MFP subunit|nr:efflux RND transporter periplasmic adaptor subunit [Flavobacteriales bacterium]